MNITRLVLRAAFIPTLTLPALAGSVRIVERPHMPPFASIQGAIDEASDGETLLVGQGTYSGFTLTGKGLSIVAEGAGLVTVGGTVVIELVPSASRALLANFTVQGPSNSGSLTGLQLSANAGHVRVQDCTLLGGYNSSPKAGHGAEVADSARVAFVGCTITGASHGNCWECSPGEPGGDGIHATNSGVALYGCTVKGGRGTGMSWPAGGNGGDGYFAQGWGVFAAGCTISGGRGGDADDLVCGYGGWGGDGIHVVSAQAQLLDNQISGGPGGGGVPCGHPGGAGTAIHNQGAVVNLLPGTQRELDVPLFASDATTSGSIQIPVTLVGEAGDKVLLLASRQPAFGFMIAFNGTWLVPYPNFAPNSAFATLSTTGPSTLTLRLRPLQGHEIGALFYVQALVNDASGRKVLSSGQHVVLLNADALPDCNANDVLDFLDTLPGLGSSPDVNNDFIPDTCPMNTEHWVDASAPPGGDGSSVAPFQDLRTGIDVSFTGYTLHVRDGLYSGARNRNLDFGGRDIHVKSENGPASCVVDCEQAGRAFVVKAPATLAARIEGLTIVNGAGVVNGGAIDADHVSVENCVIVACSAGFGGGRGGAIHAKRLAARNCVFRSNSAGVGPTDGFGGALSVELDASPQASLLLAGCRFEGNTAARGGALSVQGSRGRALLSHCDFRANTAGIHGGAVDSVAGAAGTEGLRIDDCLFAGNRAGTLGGAVIARGSGSVFVTGSTFTQNVSGGFGGAVAFLNASQALVENCILWGDSAGASGAELALRVASPSVTVAWSDVQGGQAAVHVTSGTLTWGSGNIDLDPLFSDADGPDNDPQTFSDNGYTLALASPCIDAASNAAIPPDLADIDGDGDLGEPVPLDLLLQLRRQDVPGVPDTGSGTPPLVDMGAYERSRIP